MIWQICCVLFLVNVVEPNNYVGDDCYLDGVKGTCKLLKNCMSAFNNPKKNWWQYPMYGFVRDDPIICCAPPPATAAAHVATTARPTTPRVTTTTEEYPVYDYNYTDPDDRAGYDCSPLTQDVSPAKNGQKAFDKCIEYQQQLVYPCVESSIPMGGKERVSRCYHAATPLILGGEDAMENEFPHMVLLGYGRTADTSYSADWKCGGTLISERFILTAGHCTFSRGPVTYAIVGTLRRSDDVKSSQVYRISRIIKYPEYRPPLQYHDIALLETATPVALDSTVVPACLDVFGGDRRQATATGWGANSTLGDTVDTLQKVTLTEFNDTECQSKFHADRLKPRYRADMLSCYGDHERQADTCRGDSGGPLTILNHKVRCMYTVVGVTSFGMECGFIGQPGYYTRVSYYVPWIERTVWPKEENQV